MKDKKGFTLVEVLGAVVVLVLILAIITPKIFKQFTHAGEVTDQEQINALINASKIYVNQNVNLFSDEDEDEYVILISELKQAGLINSETILRPSTHEELEGCVVVTKRNNKYKYEYEESDKCDKSVGTVKFKQVKDRNPGIICGDGDAEDYDNSTVCYIYSVEDLVAFSNMVNSGKNFSGKTVMLMENLDIQNDKSYLNAKINLFGDVNENGTISATLKEELTEEETKGFKPIGNNTNTFSGLFEGNAKTIKNIYINRGSTDYIGLFGYNAGTIRGLRVVDTEIAGREWVGIIAGRNEGTITSVIADGDASAYDTVGLAVGGQISASAYLEAITSGNVTSTYVNNTYTGGIIGDHYSGTTYGIYKSGSITANSSSYTNRTIGYRNSGTKITGALNTITVRGNTVTSSDIDSSNGYDIPASAINNIAVADTILDTYIGGDNNGDGYYYDYDSNGEFTVYKLSERPLEITMKGSGTAESPYIINNYNDLKQVGYKLGTNGTGIYYKLNKDINLTNQNSIMLGSGTSNNSSNRFTGVFDGNAHTISNLNLYGYDYTGLIGYNEGTIIGLKVVDAEVVGREWVGIIAGRNEGTITSVIADGDASAYDTVGLAVGGQYNSTAKLEAITSGNVTSTYVNSANTGGIIGNHYSGTTYGIYKSGSITANSSSYTNRTIGYNNSGTKKTGALNTITVRGNTVTSSDIDSSNGYDIPSNGINNIAVTDAILDTYLGGDNNGDGYYYDYDSNGEFTIYNIAEHPLNITMSGTGTELDPYIINNYNDLKQVGYNLGTNGTGIYYKLNADIDLSGQNSIMLESGNASDSPNRFTGVFEGNAHTISNLNLYGYTYTGLVGYNSGTIRGLKVINANILGYKWIGIIAGRNDGSVTSIISDGNASGFEYVGLAVAEQELSTANLEALTSGNATSTYVNYAYTGGIIGNHYNGTTYGIYKSGSISSGSTTRVNRTIGYNNAGTKITGALNTITVRGNPVTSSNLDSSNGYDIPASAMNNIAITDVILDTYIGGDDNNDGYYYDYDSNGEFTVYKLSDRPLNITMTGSGTENDPYIINSYSDLKQVAYKLGTNGTGIYYRLNTDIDLTNENSIMLSGGTQSYTLKHFKGVFDGNAHTISNLKLYGQDYTGLFGYNSGTIRGLKVVDTEITGREWVGIIAGRNEGTITSVIADGDASAYDTVGLAVGGQRSASAYLEALTSGNVTSTYVNNTYTGGIIGDHYSGTTYGIYKSGSITANSSSYTNRTIGYRNSGTKITGALNTITVRGNTVTSSDIDSSNGYDIPASAINNIAVTDVILDTYIGGDDNNDGYYYDYDSNGEFTVYSLAERPLNITMTGSGTENDPYIINNYSDLKQVAYKLGTNGNGIYYRLNADINLTNENSIMLSGGTESYTLKHFKGVFDGNGHTISNLNLYGQNYTGLFGYNAGTIKGLKVTGTNIFGYLYMGILAGRNDGTIASTIAEGNVSGYEYAGLAVGYQRNSGTKTEAVTSGNVTTTYGNYAYAGGISGYAYNGTTNGIYRSGSISANSSTYAYRTVGYKSSGTITTGALDTITVRGNTSSSTSLSDKNGKSYTASELQTLTPYQEVGLNTSITDPTQKEYRYALDANYNPYLIKNTSS